MLLCAICGKQVVRYLPIAVMATGTRSNVTPVVLREDTQPPAYGDKYFERASRTFYIKYTEYKKRVAHANAVGAIQREVVSIADIPSHVQRVFARVYHESRTITPTQLEVAVESHAGHGEGAEVELSACLLYTSPSPRDLSTSRMPSSA